MLISQAFDMYILDHIAFSGQSAKTQESYMCAKNAFILRFGDIDISKLAFNDVRDWKLWLERGRSANTVRNYIICLRVVLKFLHKRGIPALDADLIPVPKRVNTEMTYLTDSEFKAFLRALSTPRAGQSRIIRLRNIAIAKTIYATGLRNAELCSLNLGCIKENTFSVIGKGNKRRIGFINDDALKAIDKYVSMRHDGNSAMFVTITGTRMQPCDVRRFFREIRELYPDFAGVHPHTIRHSYATNLLKKRVDIRYVKEFMGHSSLETTAIYTHVVNEDLKDIYMDAFCHKH